MESLNLLIRKSTFDDCRQFAEWEKKPEVTEYFTFEDTRNYEEVIREFVLRENDCTMLQYTIIFIDEELPIGRIWLSRLDHNVDSLDITRIYIGNTNYRGKGYGEEAMKLLLEHCFLTLHMERVTLDHFLENKIASNLYIKLGFKSEGIARNATKKKGRYYDLNIMSMLRSEYFELINKN